MFYENCKHMGWWFKSKPTGTTISHTLMDGKGVLCVPIQQRNMFYLECMNALKNEEKLFLVEQTKYSDRFRMFLDIDYKTEEAVTDDTIKRWAVHLRRSFPTMGTILVSTCTRKEGELYKNGIHLSWPKTTVTASSALGIYNNILISLRSHDPNIPWTNILDKSVFKTGLRTIWSFKMKRETREIVEPYMPRFEVESDVLDITEDKPLAKTLEYFSILPHGNETEHYGSNETIISGIATKDDVLLTWLNELFPKHKVKIISKIIPKKTHWVLSSDSKYCAFDEVEHKNNHAWFYIDKLSKTVSAMCHDEDHKKMAGRRYMVSEKIIKYLQKLEHKQ